jgi:hypothetical protein
LATIALLWIAPAFTPSAFAQGQAGTLFNNWNKAVVENGPTAPTVFTLRAPMLISRIITYHWNYGQGVPAGTIALQGQDGRIYGGPWPTRGTSGTGGAQNVNWVAEPHAFLPAGTYTVIDSDPGTWSHNSGSAGSGFTDVQVVPLPTGAPVAARAPAVAPPGAGFETGLSAEIAGTWTSDWGQVEFAGSNRSLAGRWLQSGGNVGKITGGSYDPNTKRLVFTYYQSWNNQDGRGEFTLSSSGGKLRLTGTWKQWGHGQPEPASATSGSWTMEKAGSASAVAAAPTPARVPAAPRAPVAAPPTAAPAAGLSQEITGTWTSSYGLVSFTGSNRVLGGSWDQGGGKIGKITGGSYDPNTGRLVFFYYQTWNNQDGRAEFTLSGAGSGARLTGSWKQWTHGQPEPAVATSGDWTMQRQ